MVARASVTAVLATATLVAAPAACGSTSTSGASSEPVPPPPTTSASEPTTTSAKTVSPTVAGGPSACSDLGGQVGPDQVCTMHIGGLGYTVDISFPADYPDQKALSRVLTQQRDRFV